MVNKARVILRCRLKGQRDISEHRFGTVDDAHEYLVSQGIQIMAIPTGEGGGYTVGDLDRAARQCGYDWHEFSFLPIKVKSSNGKITYSF